MFIFLAYPRIVSTYTKSKEELHMEEEDQRYSTLAQSKYTKYIQSFEFITLTTPGNELNPCT